MDLAALLTTIADRDPAAHADATRALADSDLIDALLAHLADGGEHLDIAAELLWQHRARPAADRWRPLATGDHAEVRDATLPALARLAPAEIEADVLERVAAGDDAAIVLAGEIRLAAAVPAMAGRADELLGTLKRKGDAFRMGPDALAMEVETLPRLIVALARAGDPARLVHLPALARLVGTDEEFAEPTRALAARGLQQFAVPGMVATLQAALAKEQETEVAVAIIDALALIGTPPVIAALIKRAGNAEVAGERYVERLGELIGLDDADDAAALAAAWAKQKPDPALTYWRGRPLDLAALASGLADPARAEVRVTDAAAITGDDLGCLRPAIAARFLDLGPRLRAWATAHPAPAGTLRKQGRAVDTAAL